MASIFNAAGRKKKETKITSCARGEYNLGPPGGVSHIVHSPKPLPASCIVHNPGTFCPGYPRGENRRRIFRHKGICAGSRLAIVLIEFIFMLAPSRTDWDCPLAGGLIRIHESSKFATFVNRKCYPRVGSFAPDNHQHTTIGQFNLKPFNLQQSHVHPRYTPTTHYGH